MLESMEVIQMIVLLMAISCLPRKTYAKDKCFDVEGKPVSLGDQYFDGNNWRISRKKADVDEKMEFLEEKWKLVFAMFDFNYDGIISKADTEFLEGGYISVYKPRRFDVGYIRTIVDRFWQCSMFDTDTWPPEISETRFIAIYRKAYETDKARARKTISYCNDELLSLVDLNKDGMLSYEEMFDDYKAWNEGNEDIVRALFEMMGPNSDNYVPNKKYNDFWAEIAFGESREFFDNIILIYGLVGHVPELIDLAHAR